MAMNKYIEKAIREVAHTDNPELFAQHNQTAYQIANNVYEQLTKDAVEARVCFGQPVLLAQPIPTSLAKDGEKVKIVILKEE